MLDPESTRTTFNVFDKPVSLLDVTLDQKRPTSDSNLRRRHSVYDSSPVGEGMVLRRVASLTLDRNSVKRRRNSKSVIPQKTDCHKQFEGEIVGTDEVVDAIPRGFVDYFQRTADGLLDDPRNRYRSFAPCEIEMLRQYRDTAYEIGHLLLRVGQRTTYNLSRLRV